ncbi:MAG: restriction endonuclease subunit S [Paraclostridium sp.]
MNKTPKLRFKEFSGNWESKKVVSVFDRVSNKVDVIEDEYYEQIGIRSHGKGIFYKEPVSGKELGNKRVFWVEPDVFVVNIVFAWEQAVARTTQNEIGMIASHRFPMYRPKENILDLDYITQLFTTKKGKFLLGLASPGGAGRNKTLGQKEFDDLEIVMPSYEEQKKISSLISLIDKKALKQSQKVEELKYYKKGIMQKIFSRELRINDDNGNEYPDWKLVELNELLHEHKEKNLDLKYGKEDVLSVSGDHGIVNQIKHLGRSFAGESVHNYHIVHEGDIVYTKSPLKSNPYGIIKVNKGKEGIVSTLYAVYSCKEICHGEYLDYYFQLNDNANRYLRPLVHKGAKNDMKINNTHVLSGKIAIGCIEEQIKISKFLSKLDIKIKVEQEKLYSLNEYKKGLLQQMFV